MEIIKRVLMYNSLTNKICRVFLKLKRKREKVNEIFNEKCVGVTKKIYKVFESNKINYFYDFGNLLGIIREGHFLKHDSDIDLGIILNGGKTLKEIVSILKENNFELVSYFEYRNKIRECNFLCDGITVDLFFYEEKDGFLHSFAYQIMPKVKYTEKNQKSVILRKMDEIEKFEYRNVEGVELRIPSNYEKILVQKYGEGWKIEDKNFCIDKIEYEIMKDYAIKRFVKDGFNI
ncbi:MAG: hypothetical protein Q4G05_05325 [Clostridia bacterium]|nr:hypothetical protein [Clostridia bacterium]